MAYIDNVKAILEKDYFRKDAGWHIDIKDTKKNNGVVLSTIIVGNKNQKVAPVFYIDGYSENGYTEEAAAQSIYENYQKNIGETTRMNDNELIHKLSQFSNVKNNICYKIVNTQANKKLYSNAPHFPITDDLSVMYYLQIERGATATITNQMLDVWGIDKTLDKYEIAKTAISKTREFFSEMGIPATLKDVGIGDDNFEIMAKQAVRFNLDKGYEPLAWQDVYNIYRASL